MELFVESPLGRAMTKGVHVALSSVAGAFLVVGIAAMPIQVEAGTARGVRVECGNTLTGTPDSVRVDARRAAELAAELDPAVDVESRVDAEEAACDAAVGAQRRWVWPLTLAGVLLLACMMFVPSWPPYAMPDTRGPGIH